MDLLKKLNTTLPKQESCNVTLKQDQWTSSSNHLTLL